MNRKWMVLAAVLLLASAATLLAVGNSTPDRDLSLSKTSVFEIPEPAAEQKNTSEPGEHAAVPADFPEQPPLVPHGINDWMPITLTENQCIDCHGVEEKVEGEATPIPRSHYVDLRNAPDKVTDAVVGARYNCVTCHTAPGSNAPLVGNSFVPGG